MADKRELFYQAIMVDMQKMKKEIIDELHSSVSQMAALRDGMKADKDEAYASISKELRYGYKQNQSIYNGVESVLKEEIGSKIAELEAKVTALQTACESINVDALASAVADKLSIPSSATPEVDYERLADLVAKKLAEKPQTYDVVLDSDGVSKLADQVASKVSVADPVDYDRISEIVDNKLIVVGSEETEEVEDSFDLMLDDEGIKALAKGVAAELSEMFEVCAVSEELIEEPAEEPVEDMPEEPVQEEPTEEMTAEDELAVAVVPDFQEIGDGKYMDAETGLVIRLKKSFTAKMKQSDEKVKEYYSALKNELTSYKKINSNVSWHGDRFNFGRDTVAKITICGKTLGLYLALDPNDEEFKSTVYHQKDVGSQKAYEHTPFMVKVKSDAALKKAMRLVVALASKLETEKEENFVETDYVTEYGFATTQQLYEDGYIKATKEKKVDLDF